MAADAFIKDAGQTLFYPYGESRRGYVVPDAERESALRATLKRYQEATARIGPWLLVLIVPPFVGAWLVLDSHPFLFLAALVLPVMLVAACGRALLHYQLGSRVSGLQRVGARDKAPGYIRQILLCAAALAWVTLRIYQTRVGALPVPAGTTVYYDDISQPLTWTLVCGAIALLLANARNSMPALFGDNRTFWGMLAACVTALGLVAYVALVVLTPRPRVVLNGEGISCGWRLRWSDVSDITETSGGRSGTQYAWLKTGTAPPSALRSGGNNQQCQITGLNEDYDAVYRAIRTVWQDNRKMPARAPSGDALLDGIDIGASRQRVVAVLGPPAATAGSAYGSVALYVTDSGTANSSPDQAGRHVEAIYFDTDEQVKRVARYGVKDGKIFDFVSQTNFTGGVEAPFIYTMLFDKPHKS